MDEPRRPDPDALLVEAAKAGRGRLKVFLGMAPGVGKTYEMLSADLLKRVKGDAAALRASTGHQEIPDDAITTSGSGLDPDISPAYAALQADRIAKARGASADEVRKVIADQTQGPALGFLGQAHVNVLMTNLALDKALPRHMKSGA